MEPPVALWNSKEEVICLSSSPILRIDRRTINNRIMGINDNNKRIAREKDLVMETIGKATTRIFTSRAITDIFTMMITLAAHQLQLPITTTRWTAFSTIGEHTRGANTDITTISRDTTDQRLLLASDLVPPFGMILPTNVPNTLIQVETRDYNPNEAHSSIPNRRNRSCLQCTVSID